jgi:DNA-binding transcriptional LysR family regulator
MAHQERQARPGTVLARMVAAGIGEARAREHLARGWVRVGGAVVTDPQAPAPWPTPIGLQPLHG